MGRWNTRLPIFLMGALLHLHAAAAADVAALTFINGLPFTTIKIGAATTRLMIDSGGALGISIPQTTVSESGSVTLLDSKSKFRDIHGDVFEVQNLVANQVVIGSTPIGPIQGHIHTEWGGAPEGPEAALTKARKAGAIGLGAFGARPLLFDYAQARLVIYAPGEGPAAGHPGWRTLRLAYGKEGPSVTLRIDGKPLKFVLDTGTSVNLVDAAMLAPSAPACSDADAAREACDPRLLRDVRDESGQPMEAFQAERMNFSGAPFAGILGAPFFARRRVLIDLAGQRLLLASPGTDTEEKH